MFPRHSASRAWAVWKCHPLRLTRARSFPGDDAIGLARPRGRSFSSDGLWDILRQEDQASARGQGDSRWLERRSVNCATGLLDCQENQSKRGAPHRSLTWFRSNPWQTDSSTQPAPPPPTPPPGVHESRCRIRSGGGARSNFKETGGEVACEFRKSSTWRCAGEQPSAPPLHSGHPGIFKRMRKKRGSSSEPRMIHSARCSCCVSGRGAWA